MRALARSWKVLHYPGEFDLIDTETLIYKMAYALFCDRKGIEWQEEGVGYLPWWVANLELADLYKAPRDAGVYLDKYVWFRRALTLSQAKSLSYKFDSDDD